MPPILSAIGLQWTPYAIIALSSYPNPVHAVHRGTADAWFNPGNGPRVRQTRQGMDHQARVHVSAGRSFAEVGDGAVAQGRARPLRWRAEKAHLLRRPTEVLPGAGGEVAAGEGAGDRQV